MFDNQPLSSSVFRIIGRQPKHGKVADSYTGTAYAVLHGLCVGGGGGGVGSKGGGEMQFCLKMGPIDMTTF